MGVMSSNNEVPPAGIDASGVSSVLVLVTRDGNGHGSLGRGNTCVNAIADAYLLRLELPPSGRECP